MKIQLLSDYTNNAVSDLTATFASQEAKSIDDLIKMKPDDLREMRFFNIKDQRRVQENELTFESLFQVKITQYD